MDISILSWFRAEYAFFALVTLSVFGLIIEFFDEYPADSGRAIFVGVATAVSGYFILKKYDLSVNAWVYATIAVVAPAIYFMIRAWSMTNKATKKLVGVTQESIYARIERRFDKYAGMAPLRARTLYIKKVIDFLRGKEIITWDQLVQETNVTFSKALNEKNVHGDYCYKPEHLTNMFISDVLTLLLEEVNEENPMFMEIKPIWEVRNAHRERCFDQLIQRPHVPWLELEFNMPLFYGSMIQFILTWPATFVKNLRIAITWTIQSIFKSKAQKQINYLS